MSLEINSVVLGGNLTKDVELKETPSGANVCTLSLATNRTFVINGQKQTETSFLDIDVWGVQAENCSKYLKKGSAIVVTGRIKQDRWQTPEGANRSRLKIVASNVQFLPSGRGTAREDGPQIHDDAPSFTP